MTPDELAAWKARAAAYTEAYKQKNREKVLAQARKHGKERRDALGPEWVSEQNRKNRERNGHKYRAKQRERWLANRDEDNARRLAHHHANKEYSNQKRRTNLQKRRVIHPWEKFLWSARSRAAKKGVPFSLTREWAEERWTGRCEITDLAFVLDRKEKGPSFWSPSIDRIIPELGYTPENCRFALWAVNALKHDGTDEDMIAVARAIVAKFPL